MATYTRTSSNLIGTPASPASVPANGTSTATLTVGSGNSSAEAVIAATVIVGSSVPTTSPTVQCWFTLDGTNKVNDGGPFVVPMVAGTYYYPYPPPPEAATAGMTITNGATNSITAWAQGVPLGVS